MKVRVVEITEQEFEKISKSSLNYFINGCLFTRDEDNLIAFPIHKSTSLESLESSKYFMIEVNS